MNLQVADRIIRDLIEIFHTQTIEELRRELKDDMARSATSIIKNPEEHISQLKSILGMLRESDNQVAISVLLVDTLGFPCNLEYTQWPSYG